jgi:beta-xylosidase
MAGAKLNADMTSVDTTSIVLMTPRGGTLQDYAYREAPYVFKRNGTYYFLWSVDDTGSPNYHVAYGTSTSPLGPISVAEKPVILIQRPEKHIYGPAHNSVVQVPGKDQWYMVYHRINPDYMDRKDGPGFHREVCIDRLFFNSDGTIRPVEPTGK